MSGVTEPRVNLDIFTIAPGTEDGEVMYQAGLPTRQSYPYWYMLDPTESRRAYRDLQSAPWALTLDDSFAVNVMKRMHNQRQRLRTVSLPQVNDENGVMVASEFAHDQVKPGIPAIKPVANAALVALFERSGVLELAANDEPIQKAARQLNESKIRHHGNWHVLRWLLLPEQYELPLSVPSAQETFALQYDARQHTLISDRPRDNNSPPGRDGPSSAGTREPRRPILPQDSGAIALSVEISVN
jgi:hypothetical protein